MTEARDLAGIGIPFAAGVAAGMFLMPFLPVRFCASLLVFLTGTIVLLFLRFRRRLSVRAMRLSLGGVFFVTGLFCAANSLMCGDGILVQGGTTGTFVSEASDHLKAAIDKIPYTSETNRSLVKALLTGDRSGLGREITAIFRTSGAAHLLALSGLHLGILYLLLVRLTIPLGNSRVSRVLRCAWIVAASGFYVLMTGASPSIVRAFLFIFINEICKISGRESVPLLVLLSALTIQLALRPAVITSVGFQLSYLAMTGIIVLAPVLERLYPPANDSSRYRPDPMRKIWKAAVLSISCQAFTAPAAWWHFHTFPKYFLLTNLIAMPLTAAIMPFSVITIALSALGICPPWMVILDESALALLLESLRIISDMG